MYQEFSHTFYSNYLEKLSKWGFDTCRNTIDIVLIMPHPFQDCPNSKKISHLRFPRLDEKVIFFIALSADQRLT